MRRLRQVLVRLPGLAGRIGAGLVLGLWLAGRVLSDRWGWSQWLLWIPTPAALLAGALGLGLALAARRGGWRRGRRIAWGVVLVALVVHFALFEHRLLHRGGDEAGGLRLVHWTMSHSKRDSRERNAERVIELAGDVTILVDAWGVPREPAIATWLGDGVSPRRAGRVTVLTRLPVLELRPLASSEGIEVTLARIDASATIGRVITVFVVDLPSPPRTSRMAVARRLRAWLAERGEPPPDVVVGDFNMTRGSASLRAAFPDLRHAYDEAGAGYGATFHRAWPLYHIDHVLLAPSVRARSYAIVDPGLGRHRAQVVHLEGR